MLFSVIVILSILPASAQDNVVTGTVTDTDGFGLPGVNIKIEGTTKGTVTDSQGNFSLNASKEDILIISYIGFIPKKVKVGDRNQFNITLEENTTELNEVVVTALGVEKEKKSLGYASQSVQGEELTQARENNVINSLSGKVTGVQINQAGTGPGGTSKVVIRGYASIAGNNNPLYVIDGIPMTNPQGGAGQFGGIDYGDGISNINPDDIESINVLKGASATALYGSRGQNGVIMITTKKGRARKGVGVEINSNFTFENPLILPEFQDRFGRGSNGQLPYNENGELIDNIRSSWGPRTRGQTEVNGFPLVNWAGEEYTYQTYPDNIKDFFQTGTTFTNSIALSAGNDKTQVRLSLSHLKNESIMPNSDLERVNASINVSSKLSDKLRVEGKLNYINQEAFNRPNLTLSPDNPMNSLINMPRSINLDDLRDFRTEDGLPRLYTNGTINTWQNPFWAVNLNTNNDTRDRLIGYLKLEYRFNDWLKAHIRTGTDFYIDYRENRNATNTIYRVTPDKSYFSISDGKVRESNTDFLVTAFKDISNDLNITGSVGGNILVRESRSNATVAQGLNIPNFFVMQNALSTVTSSVSSQREVHSLYATASLSYREYLFVEASARNDWSSALPPDNWSYFYPSISASWIFTDNFSNTNFGPISFGKLRASYAEVGNDLGPGQLDLIYFVNTLSHGGQTFGQLTPQQPPVNLKPERTRSYEGGLELGLFQNKFNVDFTYYYAGTRNQIIRAPVSKASGFSTSLINAGLITNQGIELAIRGTTIQTEDFTHQFYVNFTRNRSKVEELAPNVDVYQLGGTYDQFGVRIQAEPGGEFGDIYADRAFLRDPQTGERIIGSNGLPIPDPAGIRKIGNFQPDFLAGIGNTLNYKGINFSFLFDFRVGGDIFSYSNAIAAANGNALYTQYDRLEWYAGAGGHIAEGVNENGDPNTIEVNPQEYWQFVGGRASSFAEEFLYDGSFIKLREVTLGYSLPKNLLENSFLTGVKFSIVGRNLAILYKNTPGFDPEATFNAGNDQGIEAYAFPSTRSIGFNLNLTL
ncbi:SusC/RagA family TonB-linked outer membrane protein [Mangrovivirga cuniculi]|uniref:SusC/RagA family TonB-linked outer membrane protein n=1 Tax=Mangrovivirga cuniculi TaxID=2715131 RepID=UPI0015865095|nr:SusC/RagA family TonB-linked outer membrane protein [Mangrovivirga cuniculi]